MVKTSKASFDPGDVAWLGGTEMPLIDASDNTEWGYARVRNGAVITQTGGNHKWVNGTGSSNWGMNIYAGAKLDMTAGKHTTDRLSLGAWNAGGIDGVGTVNVWGTGNFRIRENDFVTGLYDLSILAGSLIDIRDDGVFEVPAGLTNAVLGYATVGQIVAGEAGYELAYDTIGDTLFVSAIPEPASLLLLGLGLGGLALVRRRRA